MVQAKHLFTSLLEHFSSQEVPTRHGAGFYLISSVLPNILLTYAIQSEHFCTYRGSFLPIFTVQNIE